MKHMLCEMRVAVLYNIGFPQAPQNLYKTKLNKHLLK